MKVVGRRRLCLDVAEGSVVVVFVVVVVGIRPLVAVVVLLLLVLLLSLVFEVIMVGTMASWFVVGYVGVCGVGVFVVDGEVRRNWVMEGLSVECVGVVAGCG